MNIIIIGATSGIGLALAKEYAKHKSNKITITGRNQEKLNKLSTVQVGAKQMSLMNGKLKKTR